MKKVPKQVHTDNVYSQQSRIPNAGMGLFAKVDIPHGKKICTYAGRLYDATEAAYRDPTYIVNFELGKGYKLDGDGVDGDFGHFANATQVNADGIADPPTNARFCMKSKKQWEVMDEKTGELYFRGRFDLVARRNIKADEEIILDYGKGYWLTMENYWKHGPPPRSDIDVARDIRAKRRLQRFQSKTSATGSVVTSKNSSTVVDQSISKSIPSPRPTRKRKLTEKAAENAISNDQHSRKRVKSTSLSCTDTKIQQEASKPLPSAQSTTKANNKSAKKIPKNIQSKAKSNVSNQTIKKQKQPISISKKASTLKTPQSKSAKRVSSNNKHSKPMKTRNSKRSK